PLLDVRQDTRGGSFARGGGHLGAESGGRWISARSGPHEGLLIAGGRRGPSGGRLVGAAVVRVGAGGGGDHAGGHLWADGGSSPARRHPGGGKWGEEEKWSGRCVQGAEAGGAGEHQQGKFGPQRLLRRLSGGAARRGIPVAADRAAKATSRRAEPPLGAGFQR